MEVAFGAEKGIVRALTGKVGFGAKESRDGIYRAEADLEDNYKY